jgi:hypothetical protein
MKQPSDKVLFPYIRTVRTSGRPMRHRQLRNIYNEGNPCQVTRLSHQQRPNKACREGKAERKQPAPFNASPRRHLPGRTVGLGFTTS